MVGGPDTQGGRTNDERGGRQHQKGYGDDAHREGTHQYLLQFDQGGVGVETSTGMAKLSKPDR